MTYKNGSTSALARHAAKKHEKVWKEINAKSELPTNQPKVTAFFEDKPKPVEPYAVNSAKRRVLNEKLVVFIAKDMRPITVVRNAGFRAFVKELDPRYVLPKSDTIRNELLPKIYSDVMNQVQDILDKVQFVTLTTDGWTSVASDKYNAFTVHFIDWSQPEPEMTSKILECAPFGKKSTGVELEREVRRVTDRFNITSKVVQTVADNASDIKLALKLFGVPSIGCVAHTLNLAVKQAMKSCEAIKNLKEKLTKIVRTTKVSSGAKNALLECCETVGLKGKYKI